MWQRPSRWPSTGTRASRSTRATSGRPPRGMIRSMAPSRPASIIPTASRSAVGTIWTPSAGSPACSSAAAIAAWMARQERSASDPPRRIRALPERRQRAAASAATLGRLSKIMPMIPIGVRTRAMSSPFGRCQRAASVPTGSGRPAICSIDTAIASSRAGSSRNRSTSTVASATSSSLAARIFRDCARNCAAMPRIAVDLVSAGAFAIVAGRRLGAPPDLQHLRFEAHRASITRSSR